MAVEVILPRVDMDMATGKITKWFVAEGEPVAKGQALFEIESDKAAMEIEAPAEGVLRGVTGRPGDEVPVGTVVGWIVAPGENFAEAQTGRCGGRRPAAGFADRRSGHGGSRRGSIRSVRQSASRWRSAGDA